MRTETVSPAVAGGYLKKAHEFARLMDFAWEAGDWDGVGLGAVHCVISAFDAVTTARLGLRSRGEDHRDVLDLVRRTKVDGLTATIKAAARVLEMKNIVAYDARLIDRPDAEITRRRARRILDWADAIVGSA
jgi:hypothetical protein